MNDLDIGALLAEQIDRMVQAGPANPDALWQGLRNLGLDAALASEQVGGQGLEWSDVAESLIIWGAHAAPAPLAEALLGSWLAERAGLKAANGAAILFEPNADGLAALPADAWLLRPEPDGTGAALQLVAPNGARQTAAIDPDLPAAALAVVLAAQIAGGLRKALDLSIDHATARTQFGRPLGRFQAVQRLAAGLAMEAAAARAAALFGLATLARDPVLAAGVAMTRCAHAAGAGAAMAHQIHGAIGVTREYPLHRLSQALWRWRDHAGGEATWSRKLGDRYLKAGAGSLWRGVIADVSKGNRQ